MNETVPAATGDALFAAAPVAMAALDADLRLVSVNDAFATLCGLPVGRCGGLALADLWPRAAEGLTHLLREVRATHKAASNVEIELDVGGALGRTRYFLVSATSVTPPAPHALVVAFVDIDERRRRERECQISGARYRKLVYANAELVWAVDPHGKMVEPSREWEALTGQSFDEAKNYGWLDVIHPDDREITLTRWHKASAEGPFEAERRIRRFDGEFRDMLGRAVPITDESGAILEWIGADTDITERKISERTLRDQEIDLKLITASVPVRIAYLDKEERYRFVNAEFERYEGPAANVLGRTIAEVHGEAGRARFAPHIHAAMSGKTVTFEMVLGHDVRARHVAFSLVPRVERHGEVVGFYSIASDITEQRRLQDQLHHSQKMEAVGRLAGGVAHDFNNLLTVILSYASLLEDRFIRDEGSLRDVREIRRAGELATGLTRRLLAFARRDVVHAQIIDVNTVVTNVEGLLVRVLGEDVTLDVALGDALPKVKVDLGQLEQVLVNLAVNARDAMPEGGTLKLESLAATLAEQDARNIPDASPGAYVVLRVTDSGIGMSAEVRERVFEPFFTTKAAGHGTGLGLATCYGIVRHAAGHIRVASQLGVGTTFEVWLPAQEGEATAQPKPERVTPNEGREVVLFVEDEPRIRKLVTRAAKEQGYRVLEAGNGVEALRLIEAHEGAIHIVVTDVVMPEMGGRELAKRIKNRWPDIEIVFTSGYAEGTFFEEIAAQSEIHFVPKPYLVEELLQTVRKVLDASDR